MIETSDPAASLAVRFDHHCFGCGDANPIGLRLRFSPTAEGVAAAFTPGPAHQGFADVVHGGIIASVLDEAMAWATTHAGVWAVTAEMRIRFKEPLAVGEPTTVAARDTARRDKIVSVAAALTRDRDGAVIATGAATFFRVRDEVAAAWRERYLDRPAAPPVAAPRPGPPADDTP